MALFVLFGPATSSPSPGCPCLPWGPPSTCCVRQTIHLLWPYAVGSTLRQEGWWGDAQPVAGGGRLLPLHLCFCSSLEPISRDISTLPHLSLGPGRGQSVGASSEGDKAAICSRGARTLEGVMLSEISRTEKTNTASHHLLWN